jgi:type I restriction-modification system DNA methylase subunit
MSERTTEIITLNLLDEAGIKDGNRFKIYPQASGYQHESAFKSKKGTQNKGFPEFVVTDKNNNQYVIIIECKKSKAFHISTDLNNFQNIQNYAVDGVIHYAKCLLQNNNLNIIAIAISGVDGSDLSISNYLVKKDSINQIITEEILDPSNHYNPIREIFNIDDYIKKITYSKVSNIPTIVAVQGFAKTLHNYIYTHVAIEESKKVLLISGIILGLEHQVFKNNFFYYEQNKTSTSDLAIELYNAIQTALSQTGIIGNKLTTITNELSFILTEKNILLKENVKTNNSVLYEMIYEIDKHISPFIKNYSNYDIIGLFFNEFIRYTGGDGKGLGIVLTPAHVTEFMTDLIEVDMDSIVLDTCTGTGAFLISAMEKMLKSASSIQFEKERTLKVQQIKSNQLIGVEQKSHMFTLAAINMYFKGDGKTHLIHDDCFNQEGKVSTSITINNQTITRKPNKALINPPYSQKSDTRKEIDFIISTLNSLEKGGRLACIVPMSTAINMSPAHRKKKKSLLDKHRLDAVFSMPDNLFYPVGTCTCIMMFTAHIPHKNISKPTFFGYIKDDGHILTRSGRLDLNKKWDNIKNTFISYYNNLSNISGLTKTEIIDENKEWCAESFLDTDFSKVKVNTPYQNTLKQYAIYLFNESLINNIVSAPLLNTNNSLQNVNWQKYKLSDLFTIKGSKTTDKLDIMQSGGGSYPYITTASVNNGVFGLYSKFTNIGNILTIDSATVGSCFYQELNYSASDHVERLEPKSFVLNKYIGMFLITAINNEQYRYNYGRKFNQQRIRDTIIELPSISKDGKLVPDWNLMEQFIKSLNFSSSI